MRRRDCIREGGERRFSACSEAIGGVRHLLGTGRCGRAPACSAGAARSGRVISRSVSPCRAAQWRLVGAWPPEEGCGAPAAPRRGEGAERAGRACVLGLRGGRAAEGGPASQPGRIPAGGARVPQASRGAHQLAMVLAIALAGKLVGVRGAMALLGGPEPDAAALGGVAPRAGRGADPGRQGGFGAGGGAEPGAGF